MSGRHPEHAVRAAVNLQQWLDLTFLHWRVPAEDLRRRLPPGLEVELLDGSAWLGVVPFRMHDVRVPGVPALPGWSTFPECNVRTYVRGPGGRTGVWFFRLVCPRRAFVAAMRAVGLPYVHAPSVARPDGLDAHVYRFPGLGAASTEAFVCRTSVGAPLAEADRTPLVDQLTGRWAAWTWIAGRLLHVPVHHPEWPLRTAEVLLRSVPADVAGIAVPGDQEPLVHFSPGVATRIGVPGPA